MLTDPDLDFVRKLVRERSGIVLGEDKGYLIQARLKPLAERAGCKDLGELVKRLRGCDWSPLHFDVVDAMTTNETFFFRDVTPFEALAKQVLPDLARKRGATRRLSLWCAACSTGQEPYSTVMTMRDQAPQLAGWNVTMLATDLSPRVLVRAKEGRYSQQEVDRGLPKPQLERHFQREAANWRVRDYLRAAIEFRQLNLLDSWAVLGTFDIIFIRNVMIYFDVELKRALFAKLRRVLAPDGYLFLGGAESPLNLDDRFVRVPYDRAGLYRMLGRDEQPTADPQSDHSPAVR